MTIAQNPLYNWLEGDCLRVAPKLLGWKLISNLGSYKTGGRIVEVEAYYYGAGDPASHAYRGLTPRTAPMFERGGAIYVYLSHGLHCCMNIVVGPAGEAQAVLIRALEPTVGLETMAARRRVSDPRLLTRGPGRLAQALGIGLQHSGSRLGTQLQLKPPPQLIAPAAIIAGPRVGIKRAAERPWRFYLAESPFVSSPRA